ncbi:MAG: 50S ribosomal protein L32 [Alphaproteobacteria bacterium GM202ARS2]|nr:50S ribosomal protein L32 [Alphaproteobacteria bacterium GM202ARS2]
MAVPKRKISSSRRNMRRSHDYLRGRSAVVCPHCGELKAPHHVCPFCGYYKGRQVMAIKEKRKSDSDDAPTPDSG